MPFAVSTDFLLLQAAYLIFSAASVLLKLASRHPPFSSPFLALCAGSLACLFIFALAWQQALRKYDLMTAYAWRGAMFLWTFLWSALFFGETITWNNFFGAAVIIAGMILVARGE